MATPNLKFASYSDPGGLKSEEPAAANRLRDLLFPADVRVVPFGIVAGILALFLFAAAPGDYWILGWLRRRRYTWVVFPCLSLLFTTVTVGIAGYYSGNTDHRGALVIVDVGRAGRPLRTTRIMHIITAASRNLKTEIRDGLFAKTDVQPAQANGKVPGADPDDDLLSLRIPDEISYDGLLPAAYSVTRLSRQWSPAMHRLTQIAPAQINPTQTNSDIEIPKLDWAAIDRLDLGTETGRSTAVALLRRALPECGLLFASAGNDVVIPFPPTSQGAIERFREWPQVLSSLGRRRDQALLSILFAISPNGAGDLEDLAVLDDADTGSWLIHAAIVRDNDLIVFRHIVRKPESKRTPGAPLHR